MSAWNIACIAGASLAWFIVGVVAGKQLPRASAGRGARKSKGKGKTPAKSRARSGSQIELYVGNLSYNIRTKDLQQAFEKFGKVASARIIQNKFNGKSKGFGFVEMANQAGSNAACKGLNGADLKGRKLVVNEARERSRD